MMALTWDSIVQLKRSAPLIRVSLRPKSAETLSEMAIVNMAPSATMHMVQKNWIRRSISTNSTRLENVLCFMISDGATMETDVILFMTPEKLKTWRKRTIWPITTSLTMKLFQRRGFPFSSKSVRWTQKLRNLRFNNLRFHHSNQCNNNYRLCN